VTVLWLIGGVALAATIFFFGAAVGSWLNETGHAMGGELPDEVFRQPQFRERVTSIRTLVESERDGWTWDEDWKFLW
jgi:hypothetical protein